MVLLACQIFFLDFENTIERSLLCSPRLHLFDQKYSKNSNIVKYCKNVNQNMISKII